MAVVNFIAGQRLPAINSFPFHRSHSRNGTQLLLQQRREDWMLICVFQELGKQWRGSTAHASPREPLHFQHVTDKANATNVHSVNGKNTPGAEKTGSTETGPCKRSSARERRRPQGSRAQETQSQRVWSWGNRGHLGGHDGRSSCSENPWLLHIIHPLPLMEGGIET